MYAEIFNRLEPQVSEEMKENFIYKQRMLKLEDEKNKLFAESELVETEISQLEMDENVLRDEIESLCSEKSILLEKDWKIFREQEQKMEELETRYCENLNSFQHRLQLFREEKQRFATVRERLSQLTVSNVYNDTFHIWHDGHFGTINGFKLGKLSSLPVDWHEINAAWGLATLLLNNIAKKINFKFSTYRLLPSGSFSRIERNNDHAIYELYGSSDISLGRLFWYRKFDTGMTAFFDMSE